jgi:hypothetical protein
MNFKAPNGAEYVQSNVIRVLANDSEILTCLRETLRQRGVLPLQYARFREVGMHLADEAAQVITGGDPREIANSCGPARRVAGDRLDVPEGDRRFI